MSVCLYCVKDPAPPKGSAKASNMTGLSFQISARPVVLKQVLTCLDL